MRSSNLNIPFWLMIIWVAFTVSLTVWWFIFSQRQLDLITQAGFQSSAELVKDQRMLLWEGFTLICSLLAGAAAFFFVAKKERQQSKAIQNFLLTFTHELKTPIASLRLQAEELQDRVRDEQNKKLLERLVKDTSRLTLQLDNSLFLAAADEDRAILEKIEISEALDNLKYEWPDIKINVKGNAKVAADRRMLSSIFRNLINNAVVHGKAKEVNIEIQPDQDQACIKFHDDGSGFKGDISKAGQLFTRQYSGSGSGIGLHLVNKLIRILGGDINYSQEKMGLLITLSLPLYKE